ncbi:MAG TPA: hypothetical protein VHB54_03300 [Mucilaginibacter sp.]|nr:hypothetical protein [Mucilaginibacter sp.]
MSKEENKAQRRWAVVGYNILGMVGYTLLCRLAGEGGILFDCILLVAHFIICVILSIVWSKWEWILSAFLVVAIGFSACVTLLTLN